MEEIFLIKSIYFKHQRLVKPEDLQCHTHVGETTRVYMYTYI